MKEERQVDLFGNITNMALIPRIVKIDNSILPKMYSE